MSDYETATHAELLARVRALELELLPERERLIHDLEVHQAELESQNQQLRETQHLLEESHTRFSALYDFAPVAYVTFDKSGCISELNLAGAALLGRERLRLIGKPFTLFVAAHDRPRFTAHLDACLTGRDKAQTELTLNLEGRGPLMVQLASALAPHRNERMVGVRTTIVDMTEHHRAEDALRRAVRMREDFLAVVSHELKNPLSAILLGGFLLLETAFSEGTPGRETVEGMLRAGRRMRRLLSDLLDLSSMDAGRLSMHAEPLPAKDLLAEVTASVSHAIGEKGLLLEASVSDDEVSVYCDRERIAQVLDNLIGNAIKFTPRGGTISVTITRRAGGALFAVRDTGRGIARAQLSRVFDPYWQVGENTAKGTGLGLSIAKGIVEFHGGRLWVESEVSQGTTFFFTLPEAKGVTRSDRNPTVTVLPGSRPNQPTSRSAILIVDDDDEQRDLLAAVLATRGYACATAANGLEALAYLRHSAPDVSLVLLDLVMPIMDGWQFLTERGEDPRLANIPVILISGRVPAPMTSAAVGLAGHVERPFDVEKLVSMIAGVVH